MMIAMAFVGNSCRMFSIAATWSYWSPATASLNMGWFDRRTSGCRQQHRRNRKTLPVLDEASRGRAKRQSNATVGQSALR